MPGPMFAFGLLGALILAAVLEYLSLKRWNNRISLKCSLDMRLTEPGELMTFTYRICNTASWPIPSVSVSFLFQNEIEIQEGDCVEELDSQIRNCYSRDTSLMPHQVLRGTVRLSCRERGAKPFGRVYLETGDFLGLKPAVRSFDLPISVICTAAPVEECIEMEPLGGFLGDISVRRFILEDPGLILGYREYTGAEPMKAISWVQTARTGRLTVKKHDYTVDTDVAVLLDIEACQHDEAERCLSLVRTVCDELERREIPYTVLSNGDIQSSQKGVGRTHCFEIQRQIGVSSFARRLDFSRLVKNCVGDSSKRGYILIAPKMTEELQAGVRKLQDVSDNPIMVLLGKEGDDET